MRKSTQEELLCIIFGDDDFQLPNSSYRFTVDDVKDGESFWYNGIEFVRLGEEQGGVLCITKKLWTVCTFDTNTPAAWETSIIREKLNSEFLKDIDDNDILPMEIDLTPQPNPTFVDEDRTRDVVLEKMGLLSYSQYEKYRNVVPKYSKPFWLCSPRYNNSNGFCCVTSGGSVSCRYANSSRGCAPVLLFRKQA